MKKLLNMVFLIIIPEQLMQPKPNIWNTLHHTEHYLLIAEQTEINLSTTYTSDMVEQF